MRQGHQTQTASQIVDTVSQMPQGRKILLMAPVIRDRKGSHAKVF